MKAFCLYLLPSDACSLFIPFAVTVVVQNLNCSSFPVTYYRRNLKCLLVSQVIDTESEFSKLLRMSHPEIIDPGVVWDALP